MAPEILDAMEFKPDFTKQDVWAIGVIAYELCTLTLPFKGLLPSAIMKAILLDHHKPVVNQNYSADLKGLID